jgi:hypothetical protein
MIRVFRTILILSVIPLVLAWLLTRNGQWGEGDVCIVKNLLEAEPVILFLNQEPVALIEPGRQWQHVGYPLALQNRMRVRLLRHYVGEEMNPVEVSLLKDRRPERVDVHWRNREDLEWSGEFRFPVTSKTALSYGSIPLQEHARSLRDGNADALRKLFPEEVFSEETRKGLTFFFPKSDDAVVLAPRDSLKITKGEKLVLISTSDGSPLYETRSVDKSGRKAVFSACFGLVNGKLATMAYRGHWTRIKLDGE